MGGAAGFVPHHEHIHVHGLQIADRIQEALTFEVAEVATLMLSTSADRRLAANSKVVRVRVLVSKNRLTTVLPRSKGTFLTACSVTLEKDSAVSMIFSRSARLRPSKVRKCRRRPEASNCSWWPGCMDSHRVDAELQGFRAAQFDALPGVKRDLAADAVGSDRDLAAVAFDQHP